jgi:hypothetical protein
LYWWAFIKQGLAQLSQHAQDLTLIMDGSVTGRSWVALIVGVVYAVRALPIGWLVVKGKKDHFGQDKQRELLTKIQPLFQKVRRLSF